MIFGKVDVSRFDELDIFGNEDFEEYKRKRIKSIEAKECDVFVVENDNRYIGEVTVKYSNGDLDNETIPNIRVYIEAFRICEEYQNQGIGQKFMSYLLNFLENIGYTEFTIGVEDSNHNAKHIYEKFGFIESINRGFDNDSQEEYTLYLKTSK